MKNNWPKLGDKLFSETDQVDSDFHRESLFCRNQPQAGAFYDAAITLIDNSKCEDRYKDYLIIPVCYLFRHSVEIRLKNILKYCIETGRVKETKSIVKVLKGHSLQPLWNKAKHLIEDMGDDPDLILATETIILELHNTDRTGQTFRYYQNTDETVNDYSQLPIWINKKNLRDRMEGLNGFLSSCELIAKEDFQNG
ncbi:hypothetical protein [Rubinisphaera italica]|uniref:Uncharacterized protein n=1 Tax=Rubinisphaera italica TaxID=2527969 RepID=A0A5C5XIS0_9PLAN|nr:hypothetical protein [Rubinisphaera italica]TWT62920.1 hypothetical protein Pan54_36710 [Rubinisphaera italica]